MTEELKQAISALQCAKRGHCDHAMADEAIAALEALTQRPEAQEGEAFESVLIDGVAYDLQAPVAAELLRLHLELQARESLPTQPAAQTDSMGMPTSCGKPLCSPDEHHPLCKLHQPAAQATPEPLPLGPLAKRNIYDAIRGAYDLGYNDARNARTVPGDSAPGYDGRSVEEDHGSALFNLLSKRLKPATPEPVGDVRCEGCGYMTHHREHMGCVRAAKQHTRPAPGVPEGSALFMRALLQWAVGRWQAEVQDRPMVNKNRRTLDDTWRQVIRFAGGNPDALVGPSHDDMLAAAQAKGADHA